MPALDTRYRWIESGQNGGEQVVAGDEQVMKFTASGTALLGPGNAPNREVDQHVEAEQGKPDGDQDVHGVPMLHAEARSNPESGLGHLSRPNDGSR